MNLLKLSFLFTLVIFSNVSIAKERISQVLDPKMRALVLKTFNDAQADKTFPWDLISDQSFKVNLDQNKYKGVIFAAFSEANSYALAILSADGTKVIQTLDHSESGIMGIFAFKKIQRVSFSDLNGDGTLDISIVMTLIDGRPAQGEGIGNQSEETASVNYFSHKDKFTLKQ